jgi:hypothetical protein
MSIELSHEAAIDSLPACSRSSLCSFQIDQESEPLLHHQHAVRKYTARTHNCELIHDLYLYFYGNHINAHVNQSLEQRPSLFDHGKALYITRELQINLRIGAKISSGSRGSISIAPTLKRISNMCGRSPSGY